MKLIIIAFFLVFATGCSSSPPKPPEPKGALVDVNPESISIDVLRL